MDLTNCRAAAERGAGGARSQEDNSPIKHESLIIMHSSRTVTLEAVLRQHREVRQPRKWVARAWAARRE